MSNKLIISLQKAIKKKYYYKAYLPQFKVFKNKLMKMFYTYLNIRPILTSREQ